MVGCCCGISCFFSHGKTNFFFFLFLGFHSDVLVHLLIRYFSDREIRANKKKVRCEWRWLGCDKDTCCFRGTRSYHFIFFFCSDVRLVYLFGGKFSFVAELSEFTCCSILTLVWPVVPNAFHKTKQKSPIGDHQFTSQKNVFHSISNLRHRCRILVVSAIVPHSSWATSACIFVTSVFFSFMWFFAFKLVILRCKIPGPCLRIEISEHFYF